jgi:copper(I)-binding protein
MPLRTRLAAAPIALLAIATLLAGCGSGGGSSPAVASSGLQVVDTRVDRPALPDQTAVRLVVRNGSARADTLTSVSSPDATGSSIHRSTTDSAGRSIMKPVRTLAIPARSDVTFAPGGLHVMLTGITRSLKVGDTVRLTFTFAHAGHRTVTARVVEPGTDPSEHDHG